MYLLAKISQATGMTILLVFFIKKFPQLMSHQELALGMIVFIFGWIIEAYLLKK